MPRTKSKTANPATNGVVPLDVLTLDEAAEYLRVSTADVLVMIKKQGLPGRRFGTQWRFKTALQDWLSRPQRRGILGHVGKIKDDPYLDEMLKDIYARRGRRS